MRAKLRHPPLENWLTVKFQRDFFPSAPPHLLYANINFETPETRKDQDLLLGWLRFFRSGWSQPRILKFLEQHQPEFRQCLTWLANGCEIDLADRCVINKKTDELWDLHLEKEWASQREVRFLQKHALDHGRIVVSRMEQRGSWFSGIRLEKTAFRDPLDPICWLLISMLMFDGTVGVRRCKYPKCAKFFRPATARKLYCSDLCRAKDFSDKKSLEEKSRYMREYRRNPRVVVRSRPRLQ